jgi:hypothetical protein
MHPPNAEKQILNHFDVGGIAKSGLVTAIATALHAETEGASKGQFCGDGVKMQGYAVAKRTNINGARNAATSVPIL